jgi:mono/diheme cytochrome c family protein
MRVSICCIVLTVACGFAPSYAADASSGPAPGLKLTLKANGVTDVRPARLVALRAAANEPPSPFLSPGEFKATWEGTITQRIKGDYRFAALGHGTLKVTINDAVALDVTGDDLSGKPGPTVTLKKGKNTFRAEYASPKDGEAAIRLVWIPKGVMPESVPPTVFSHDAEDEKLVAQNRLRRGRALVAEHRCIQCHTADFKPDSGAMPELAQDAPNLDGIGGRVNQAWLAQWIDNPQHFRPTTAMPRVFKKPADEGKVADEAADIAAYLATDGNDGSGSDTAASADDDHEGARLFANLGCVGCHVAPTIKEPAATPNLRNPLAHVKAKWKPPALIEFLKKPEQHYAWSKMPNFRFTDDEARQLAAYLISSGAEAKDAGDGGDPKKGQELFQSSGCINCHASATKTIASTLKTKSLAERSDFTRGCMAKDAAARGSAPDFAMTHDDRAAIAALAATKFESLKKDTLAEFAERQVATLNCTACHARDRQDDTWSSLKDEVATILRDVPPDDHKTEEQFAGDQSRPPLTWLGEKLRPQWAAQFIGGKVEYKPRPWLRARMPGFPARAEALAQGQAAAHGVPTIAPPHETPDLALAEIGKKLVARQGGFACVQCHGVGEMKPFAAFEAPAINFSYVSDRLTREYYDRWVYNPQRVLPGTRMPAFADSEGKTPLKDIEGGDAKKQFDAIWNYLLMGKEMQPPE